VAPELLLPQVIDSVDDDLADVVADRKEPGRERLGELCLHLPRILVDPALIDIDVPELAASYSQTSRPPRTLIEYLGPS
jgi:hypothetical protein